MNLLTMGIGSVVETVGKIAGDLITTDKERIELALEEKRIDQATSLAQMDVNKVEAQHSTVFVAGWRPFIGWVGGVALAYQFILYPLLLWAFHIAIGFELFPEGIQPPPMLPTDSLWLLISGMLGIGGMRSLDKIKGVATSNIWKK